MTTDLQALIQHLRGGDWNLRAPQEMADMIADKLEAALAAAPSTSPAAAAVAEEPVAARIAELEAELDDMAAALQEARQAPWPAWAVQIMKTVRDYSGYDGYDDQDGVDLPEEVRECLEEFSSQIERLGKATPHPSPSAAEQAGRAALAEAHARGLISGLEIGIEQGASSAPSASHAEAPADGRVVAWFRGVMTPDTPMCAAEYDEECCPGEDRPAGEGWIPLYAHPQPVAPAGQAAAGVQGEKPNRNDPVSALAIRAIVAKGYCTQEQANECFSLACDALEAEAARMNEELPWATRVPAPAVERGVAEEREAFEAALKQTWKMVDPLKPCGQPGSYARGEYNGICAALTTVRENFARALSTAGKEQALTDELPSVVDAMEFRREQYQLDCRQWSYVLGMQPSHYSEFLVGKRSLPKRAMSIAYAFGVPADCLLQSRPTLGAGDIDRRLSEMDSARFALAALSTTGKEQA